MKTKKFESIGDEVRKEMLSCEAHGIYEGYVMTHNGRRIESSCQACFDLEIEMQRFNFKNEACRRYRNSLFNRACIPERYADKKFDSFIPPNDSAKAVQGMLMKFAEKINIAKKQGTSFLMTGTPGSGKTHLACATANHILENGHSALYISLGDLLSQIKVAWKASEDTTEDQIICRFAEFDLLIVDEICTTRLKDADPGIFFRLVNHRYEKCKPTIGISKFNEGFLRKQIGDDTIRRLKSGGGGTLIFSWQDYER